MPEDYTRISAACERLGQVFTKDSLHNWTRGLLEIICGLMPTRYLNANQILECGMAFVIAVDLLACL